MNIAGQLCGECDLSEEAKKAISYMDLATSDKTKAEFLIGVCNTFYSLTGKRHDFGKTDSKYRQIVRSLKSVREGCSTLVVMPLPTYGNILLI
jgi:hypothetical protein